MSQRIRTLIMEARQSVAGAARAQPPCAAQPEHVTESIPGYTLHEVIHRGGQGTVYEATQIDTERRVAVKIMHERPIDQACDVFRFKREVDILSQLRHPGLVALYDGGIENGRPYLVMELIRGRSIDRFVREQESSIDDCLRLFADLCETVGEAHVRGVVHRDLKPSNVLVDDAGRPHVLDFGLAKLLATEPGKTLPKLTETGQFVGSLMWAAPEQAGGMSYKVDTRTDVHALGLILFDALTKQHAFDFSGPVPTSIDRIICAEPRRPSSIHRGITDELDTLVLKCLQKDRNRRYHSAKELGADIRRYLAGEAIDAKRDSTWYVLRKAARRHRLLLGGAITALVAALVYTITVTALLSRATTAERLAEKHSTEAQRKYELARETLEFLVDEVSTTLATIGPARESRRTILYGAYSRLQALLDHGSDDPALTEDVAGTHLQLGDIALTIGEVETAEQHFRAALSVLDGMAEKENIVNANNVRLHALAYIRVGDVFKGHGDLIRTQDSYEAAHHLIEEAVALEGTTRAGMSDLVWSLGRRGWVQLALGRMHEAAALYNEQLAAARRYADTYPDSVDARFALFMAHRHLAETARHDRDARAEMQWNVEALALGEALLQLAPDNLVYRRRVAAAYFANARLQFAQGNTELGSSHLSSAETLLEATLREDPEVIETQRDLAVHRLELGHQSSRQGDWAAAAEHYAGAAKWWRGLFDKDDITVDVCRRLFRATYGAALANYEIGDRMLAREYASEALAIAHMMLQEGAVDQGMIKFYADFLRLVGRRVLPNVDAAIGTLDDLVANSTELAPITRLSVARANCFLGRWEIGAAQYATALPLAAGMVSEEQFAKFECELQQCQEMNEQFANKK